MTSCQINSEEIEQVFEIEYESVAAPGETLWSFLDNPEIPDDFLQSFIVHTSNMLARILARENGSSRFAGSRDYATGRSLAQDTIERLELALDLMFTELARRVDGIKT